MSTVIPVATVTQLHLQQGRINIPIELKGKAGCATLLPSAVRELGEYLKNFRHVSLSGPFELSISAGISAKVSYAVDVAIVPASCIDDPPTDKHGVASIATSGSVFLSNIAPPNSIVLGYDPEFVTLQLKPPPAAEGGLEPPLFVAGWMSEGTSTESVATCYLHCTVSVAGKAYYKSWK